MKKIRAVVNTCVSLSLILLFTDCKAQSNNATSQIYDAKASTKDTSIAGKDRNRNGIRDDIEAELKKKYSGSIYRASLRVAIRFQSLLLISSQASSKHDPANLQKLADATTNLYAIQTCVYNQFGFDKMKEMGDFIQARTINTDARARAYQQGSQMLSGLSFDDTSTKCVN